MWHKLSFGLRVLTVYNLLAAVYILWDYSRGGGVSYFLTTPLFAPFSLIVLGFDLYLAVGAILAVFSGKLWWWKIGVVNFGYAVIIDLIVLAKLFFGSKAGLMGASDFWLNLMIYSIQLIFFALVLNYWLLSKSYFKVKK